MSYNKPFLSYEQLINKLVSEKGLRVENRDFARQALETYSYYDLVNGYQEVFLDNNNKYLNRITMEYLVAFHLFDKTVQSILLKYSLQVETRFKNTLAYFLGHNLGVDVCDYLNGHYYKTKVNKTVLKKVLKRIANVHRFGDYPTKHYRENHNHIPPWILFKNTNFVDVIDLYILCNQPLKHQITESLLPYPGITLDEKVRTAINALSLIRKYRNAIAHNLKFIRYQAASRHQLELPILERIVTNILVTPTDIQEGSGKNDVYSMMLSILILLNDKTLVANYIKELLELITPSFSRQIQDVQEGLFADYCIITGIPEDLSSRLQTYVEEQL
ncbi:MAG TPA: Abi family protein [Oscillospiraceae bacterium]|nr:Abi family protein [Oscillospiraceae bacterium]